MPSFEDAGRLIDRELAKLQRFFEKEVKPNTKRRAAEALKVTARKLSNLARDMEGRGKKKT